MAKLGTMTIGVPGVELWIEYNANNLRIQRVEWTIPQPGVVIRARIWETGILVFDRTEGQGNGSQNVPGNWTMVQEEDPNEPGNFYPALPPGITYSFQMQTIG